jgi:hypothetical protein
VQFFRDGEQGWRILCHLAPLALGEVAREGEIGSSQALLWQVMGMYNL